MTEIIQCLWDKSHKNSISLEYADLGEIEENFIFGEELSIFSDKIILEARFFVNLERYNLFPEGSPFLLDEEDFDNIKEKREEYVILPIFLYEHGSYAMYVGSLKSEHWDTSVYGYCVVKRSDWYTYLKASKKRLAFNKENVGIILNETTMNMLTNYINGWLQVGYINPTDGDWQNYYFAGTDDEGQLKYLQNEAKKDFGLDILYPAERFKQTITYSFIEQE